MANNNRPVANPSIVFREDFDDWAILFDPDSGNSFGINPVGVFVWKRLDGKHSVEDILVELRCECEDVPPEAEEHILDFVKDLVGRGLVGYAERNA